MTLRFDITGFPPGPVHARVGETSIDFRILGEEEGKNWLESTFSFNLAQVILGMAALAAGILGLPVLRRVGKRKKIPRKK